MNQFFASALIIVSSFSASIGHAKELRMMHNLRISAQKFGVPAAVKSKRHFAPQCANFSGNWEGICVDDEGQIDHSTISIQQDDCSSVTLDGFEFPLNGSVSLQSAPNPDDNHAIPYTGTVAYEWNDSQTRLSSLATVTLFGGRVGTASNSNMWLAGDQLRVKDDKSTPILAIDGTSDWHASLEDCTYSRVSDTK